MTGQINHPDNPEPVEITSAAGKKNLPELCSPKSRCCGCSACFAVCPVSAITMKADDEGFLYPVPDPGKCIRCGRCISVCAFKADQETSAFSAEQWNHPACYAARHKVFETRMASRSGGVFTALSDRILASEGVVYGCVLDRAFRAVHVRAEDAEKRDLMRGSKYIQSDMEDVFRAAKADLENGRKILFSGTSCQIAGLHKFLGRDYPNLLSVDIVCHGVPSPLVFLDYLHWQEKKNASKVISADFRNKKDFGWKLHIESLFLENGRRVDSRVFTNLFYGHNILRPACYECPYKKTVHPGDITIADYWGIDTAAPGFNDDKGVSLVLINNDKGMSAFKNAMDALDIRETRIEDSMQPALSAPFPKPKSREAFWMDYKTRDFELIARKYGGYGFLAGVKRKAKRLLKKLR